MMEISERGDRPLPILRRSHQSGRRQLGLSANLNRSAHVKSLWRFAHYVVPFVLVLNIDVNFYRSAAATGETNSRSAYFRKAGRGWKAHFNFKNSSRN